MTDKSNSEVSDEKQETDYDEKYGFLALLDALGVRDLSLEDSKEYMESINTAIEFFIPFHEEKGQAFELRTFGDSVLFFWEVDKNLDPESIRKLLNDALDSIATFLCFNFEQGFMFRGAISIGKILLGPNTILGPALTDTAMWHEKAEWIGLLATPSFSHWINQQVMVNSLASTSLFLYDVPMKNGEKLRAWALEWANTVGNITDKNPWSKYAEYSKFASQLNIPAGAELKHKNTAIFNLYCMNKPNTSCNTATLARELSIEIPDPSESDSNTKDNVNQN